jgi:hypothetical protein
MNSRDSTANMARDLWSAESQQLEPAEFQARFDAIYDAAQGLATLWQLGGAANDYLRARPQSIRVPPELISQLLAGKIVDGRIVGIKLLNRRSPDVEIIRSSIERALASQHESEVYGGLHELGGLLDRTMPGSPLPAINLKAKLLSLQSSEDPYIRDRSTQLIEQLTEQNSPTIGDS